MPIVLGIVAAIFIGISDTFGRASSRRAESVSHVTMQMGVGVIISVPVALAMGSELIASSLLSGVMSGVLVATGLSIVYRAMADSSSAIAAPAAAVLAAIVPLVWDLVGGAALEPLAAVGCVVALASLALTTYSPGDGGTARGGLVLALAGGLLFGLSIVFGADTDPDAGAWPAAAQRLAGFVAMAALARSRRVPPILPEGVRKFGVLGGIAGAIGMIAWIVGAQQGDLGTVSVIASTYPAVIVLLASRFDEDEVEWWQMIGIAGAIAGTALIALA